MAIRAYLGCTALLLFLVSTADSQPARRNPDLLVERVVFHPLTNSGETGPVRLLTLTDSLGRDAARRCVVSPNTQVVCRNIPKGTYEYALRMEQNGRIVKGTVHLYEATAWVTVGLGPAFGTAGDFEGFPIRGTIRGLPKDRGPTWVNLHLLYGGAELQTEVEESGAFKLEHVAPGRWMLSVLNDSTVFAHQVYDCCSSPPAPVDITAGAGRLIR